VDPITISAIIGAVTTAATTAAGAIQNEVLRDGQAVGCVFVNKTRSSWDVHLYSPLHGSQMSSGPSYHVRGFDEFKAKMALTLTTQDDTELDKVLAKWAQTNMMEQDVSDWVAKWDYKPQGMGVEGAVVFTCTGPNVMVGTKIVCLARKIPGGSFGAGVSMSTGGWLQPQDAYGTDIVDHIKSVHTSLCAYSDGEGTKSASVGPFSISFTPGSVVAFELTDTGMGL
jgi:hypothetical protein